MGSVDVDQVAQPAAGVALAAVGHDAARVLRGRRQRRSRKQAEQRLLDVTRRLDFLVTESPAVVYTLELHPAPRPKFISRNVEKILGWKPEMPIYRSL